MRDNNNYRMHAFIDIIVRLNLGDMSDFSKCVNDAHVWWAFKMSYENNEHYNK